jgi:TolB-like protein/DNA-binding winged helix-turn-helix (wHTH) protein/Tfp pilus assembly protein PilF
MKDSGKIGESRKNGVMMCATKGDNCRVIVEPATYQTYSSLSSQPLEPVMQNLAHQKHCFAEFTLDLTRGCLLHFQQEIKLRPKSFEVLKYLVENNERLISKDELIAAVWIETAVTDSSLVQCLKDIRHALHDENQQIIKTIHGRGYIFDKKVSDTVPIAPVTTYREETAGVQIIIEEEEANGHGVGPTRWLPAGGVKPIAAHEVTSHWHSISAIRQPKWLALSVLSLTVVAASVIYFVRPTAAIDSVAVMPFVNVSGDSNTEYLSDGISDNIISRLSKLPNLRVIALNSVMRYKGKQAEPQEIGRTLNVRAVLMSRLTQHGDDVSISTELIDVRDNRRLWGEQYNRKLSDIAAVQTEIAQEISDKLRMRLTGEVKQQLAKGYTQNPEAYQLYMLGRFYRRRSTKEGFDKSINYLEQAIQKDPNYALAYAELGEVYRNLSWHGFAVPKECRQKEELATLKALQIDNSLAEAHVLMANIKEMDLDWASAENEYKHALELDPNSVRVHETYAWNLEMMGRLDEAATHLKRALELDPLGLDVNWDVGVELTFARQYDASIQQLKKIIEMDPNWPLAHSGLVVPYQQKGMYEEAIAEVKKANALGLRGGQGGLGGLGLSYALAGKKDEAQKILDQLKDQQSKGTDISPFGIALTYMGLGDKDQAFEWFNKTLDENPYRLAFIKVNPRFDSLRSDPRFADLLRRLKLAT